MIGSSTLHSWWRDTLTTSLQLVDGFVGSYLKELDKAASEAASVPLSEVVIDVLDELNDQTRVTTVLTKVWNGNAFVSCAYSPAVLIYHRT